MVLIKQYPHEELLGVLLHNFGVRNCTLKETSHGMDNSVYIALCENIPTYTLKIIETKPKERIECAIGIIAKVSRNFCKMRFLPSKDGSYIIPFREKNIIVARYIEGRIFDVGSGNDEEKYALFMAKFHESFPSEQEDAMVIASSMFSDIQEYYNLETQEGVREFFPDRSSFYEDSMSFIREKEAEIKSIMKIFPCFSGITHGDLTPENIVVSDDQEMSFIDPDGIEEDGHQIYDLVQGLTKSGIASDRRKLQNFISFYINERRACFGSDSNAVVTSLMWWCYIFSIKALLSTDYYTFFIDKLTVDWSMKNASSTLNRLMSVAQKIRSTLDTPVS